MMPFHSFILFIKLGMVVFLKGLLKIAAFNAPFSLSFNVNFLVFRLVIPIIFLDKSHLCRVPVDLQLE